VDLEWTGWSPGFSRSLFRLKAVLQPVKPRWTEPESGCLPARYSQGQRTLNGCSSKDFQHEVLAPTATVALHGHALAAGMLLQKRQREAPQPRKVLAQVRIPNP